MWFVKVLTMIQTRFCNVFRHRVILLVFHEIFTTETDEFFLFLVTMNVPNFKMKVNLLINLNNLYENKH